MKEHSAANSAPVAEAKDMAAHFVTTCLLGIILV
jgi:hypothetical protein